MTILRPLPVVTDPDTAGFWQAAVDGRVAIRTCADCGQVHHLPKAYCHGCGGWNTYWRTVSGHGRVYTWTTIEHQVHPAFPVPHTIVLVELDDAPEARLVGCVPGRPHLEIGMAAQVTFEAAAHGTVLPQWSLAGSEPPPTADADVRAAADVVAGAHP